MAEMFAGLLPPNTDNHSKGVRNYREQWTHTFFGVVMVSGADTGHSLPDIHIRLTSFESYCFTAVIQQAEVTILPATDIR
jgi:hypothetical protein